MRLWRFEHTPVLAGLDFTLQSGEVLGVIGANGSGKSTLLQVLATLRRPHRGGGSVLGADARQPVPAAVRAQICLVAHQPALYAQLSLQENLRFVAELFDRPTSIADEALVTVGLSKSAGRRVDRCSHGMVRRADLARALITEPTLLLLDEAHAGLDPADAGSTSSCGSCRSTRSPRSNGGLRPFALGFGPGRGRVPASVCRRAGTWPRRLLS